MTPLGISYTGNQEYAKLDKRPIYLKQGLDNLEESIKLLASDSQSQDGGVLYHISDTKKAYVRNSKKDKQEKRTLVYLIDRSEESLLKWAETLGLPFKLHKVEQLKLAESK